MRRLLLCCLLLCTGTARAQTVTTPPAPYVPHAPLAPPVSAADATTTTLRITTRTVEISAVVSGKDGVPLPDLHRDDFSVKQDGAPVQLRYFAEGNDLPLTLALLVDTSGSQRTLIGDEVLASDVFFQTMLTDARDRAMLVQVDAGVVERMPLTSSAAQLHLALTGLGSNAAQSNGTRLLDAVYAVSRLSLAGQSGRKAIVILSDGGDNGSRKSIEDAIAEAERSNVQIYSVLYSDPHGGVALAYGLGGLRAGTVDTGAELLQRLSRSTGGRVYTVDRGTTLRRIYAELAEELRVQYQLGYTPAGDMRPNSFHRLDVTVRDKKLQVQTRSGFFTAP